MRPHPPVSSIAATINQYYYDDKGLMINNALVLILCYR